MTRFVEANMNATAEMKWAPFKKSNLAAASAAKEHDEDAEPNTVAIDMLLRSGSPI